MRVYQLNAVSRLHWVGWDNEFVVFDETSGQTNCMQPEAALVLDLLGDGALTIREISEKISAIPGIDGSFSQEFFLENVLNELATIGLVEVSEQ